MRNRRNELPRRQIDFFKAQDTRQALLLLQVRVKKNYCSLHNPALSQVFIIIFFARQKRCPPSCCAITVLPIVRVDNATNSHILGRGPHFSFIARPDTRLYINYTSTTQVRNPVIARVLVLLYSS